MVVAYEGELTIDNCQLPIDKWRGGVGLGGALALAVGGGVRTIGGMGKMASSRVLALRIVETLQGAGHVAYFAGGCVRDGLMGREPADFDVATSARPEQVLAIFPRAQKVGAAFGVVLVREKQTAVEVATFRTEGVYSDGRRPDSVTFTDAQHDAARRDFTCNGLFLDPVREQIHDFVGGREDIAAKTLRAIGDAAKRFGEDHLRLMRAVRFAAKLEFAIEPTTWAAMVRHAEKIEGISRERIGEELRMMLEATAARRTQAVALLEASGLLEHIWPREGFATGLLTPRKVAWTVTPRLPDGMPRETVLVAMSVDMAAGAALNWGRVGLALQQNFTLSNQERDDIVWLGDRLPMLGDEGCWQRPVLKRVMADRRFEALKALHAATVNGVMDERLVAALTTYAAEGVAPEPLVTGQDLIKMGAAPGPKFKAWLDALYDRQLALELRTREEGMAAAAELVRSK